jgi:hypothetical protein
VDARGRQDRPGPARGGLAGRGPRGLAPARAAHAREGAPDGGPRGAGRPAGHLIRLGKEDDDEIVFAVVEELRDGSGNVSYRQEARVGLRRAASASLETDAPDHDIVRTVRERFERLLTTHTSDDIRRALVKTLASCAAITLREHGGVHLGARAVRRHPAPAAGRGRRHRREPHRHRPHPRDPGGGEGPRGGCASALEEDLTALSCEIEAFLQEPPDRVSTLTRRLATFDELRSKARLYHSVLQVKVSDLDAKLDELTRHVEGLLQAKAS